MSFDSEFPFQYELAPIPAIFHSLEKDGPFEACVDCGRPLRVDHQVYVIERAFRGEEPIFEYAMCMECRAGLRGELSQESQDRIQAHFVERFDLSMRIRDLDNVEETPDVGRWLEKCFLSGRTWEDARNRQVYAVCQGDQLQLGTLFPCMISGQAIHELSELLSEQTKGWMEDFVGDRFGMPPEFCEDPDVRPVLL